MLVNEDFILLLKLLVLSHLCPMEAGANVFQILLYGHTVCFGCLVHKFGFCIVNVVYVGRRCTACNLSAVQNFALVACIYVNVVRMCEAYMFSTRRKQDFQV